MSPFGQQQGGAPRAIYRPIIELSADDGHFFSD